jgi:hypothetical protein
MNREPRWYMSMDSLWEYPKSHPLFMCTEPQFNAFSRLSSLYSDLSAGVHGRAVKDFEMHTALKKIVLRNEDMAEQAVSIEKCVEAANFVLACFHRTQAASFQPEDRQIILRTMTPRARQVWQDIEP